METPKEKAEELVEKYENVDILQDYSGMDETLAIECAKIAVDEMINLANSSTDLFYEREYLQEVKNELEKM